MQWYLGEIIKQEEWYKIGTIFEKEYLLRDWEKIEGIWNLIGEPENKLEKISWHETKRQSDW